MIDASETRKKRLLKIATASDRSDILWKLADLHKQATVERSHYYTGRVILDAIGEIVELRAAHQE
jgi:hypothetical protein